MTSSATVHATDTPQVVLDEAREFLARDPVRHNLILTLLYARVTHPEPGRYWVVRDGGAPVGVVLQSPLDFVATTTPMLAEAVVAAADAIADRGVQLPGITGDAATAARFAGHWSERTRSAAWPVQGQRIYEVERVVSARATIGRRRAAVIDDRDLLRAWLEAFAKEVEEPSTRADRIYQRRLPSRDFWIWEDAEPVAMAGLSNAVHGVARIGPVYTPADRRNHGYASALVGSLSATVLTHGTRCILYTDLANPTSNAIYRALGYYAVAEVLRYRFERPEGADDADVARP